MNETLTRMLTAFALIPFVLYLLYAGSWAWVILVAVFSLVALHEYYTLMESKGFQPMATTGFSASAVLLASTYALDPESILFVMTATILGILVTQLSRRSIETAIPNIAVTLSGVLYIPWLLGHGIFMRELRWHDQDVGFLLIFFCLATTFLGDTGGYFAGRKFGKHKIVPAISPKKSWEGLVGGILMAGAGAAGIVFLAATYFDQQPLSYLAAVLLGATNVALGLCGDLVESMLKRDADVKDSGSLLPGHGGILDRIDGVLFTIPINYHILRLLLS